MVEYRATLKPLSRPWKFSLSWNTNSDGDKHKRINPGVIHALKTTIQIQELQALFFITSMQGLQTIGLYTIEIIVNASRDENHWRQASAIPRRSTLRFSFGSLGVQVGLSSITSALQSLPSQSVSPSDILSHQLHHHDDPGPGLRLSAPCGRARHLHTVPLHEKTE